MEELLAEAEEEAATTSTTVTHVTGIDRTKIQGSFLISAFANDGTTRHHVGTEAVLSRWQVEGCANCQNHLLASATFPVPDELLGADGLLADRAITLEAAVTTHTESAEDTLLALTPSDAGVLRTELRYPDEGGETEAMFYAEVRTAPPAK